jgi:hypothetical protein
MKNLKSVLSQAGSAAPETRQFASICLVVADLDWADGLILLGSPGAGSGLF